MSTTSFEQVPHSPEAKNEVDGLEHYLLDPSLAEDSSYYTGRIISRIALATFELQQHEAKQAGVHSEELDAAIRYTELMLDEDIPSAAFHEIFDAIPQEGKTLYGQVINPLFDRFDELEKEGFTEDEANVALIEEHNATVEQAMYEKLDPAEIMVDVTQAAENNTLVYMYAASGIHTRRGKDSGVDRSRGGYDTFGSGSTDSRADQKLLEENLPKNPASEFVQFLPLSSVAEGQPAQARNLKNGQEEDGVIVRYKFAYNEADGRLAGPAGGFKLPPYFEQSGRGQNFVEVATVLPKSTADNLRVILSKNPEAIRVLVDDLVQHEGGLTQNDWSEPKLGQLGGRITQRPPYEGLPADWQIQVFDAQM